MALCLIFLAGFSLIFGVTKPIRSTWSYMLATAAPAGVFLWLVTKADAVDSGADLTESYGWVSDLGLNLAFRLDGLSWLFSLIITGIGACVAIYIHYYFRSDKRRNYFYCLFFMFMTSMLGLVWANNLLALFVFLGSDQHHQLSDDRLQRQFCTCDKLG